jgi:hypothetical protein
VLCPSKFVKVRTVTLLVWAKQVSSAKIYRQLAEVHGDDEIRVQLIKKWRTEFENGRTEIHDNRNGGTGTSSAEANVT